MLLWSFAILSGFALGNGLGVLGKGVKYRLLIIFGEW